ncbi:sensor histidine kinase [Gloeothece verrucosa]|uniref:histidine kinase n=1 Tax=Gloeothece verrucosa (strain PCC 7822) TaxID=497965 RepID=E0UJX1_GLOV7|nr:HAMP domain-containing sensor histidine kinase [Gloeothece verrucosa]ADN13482.1 histidine kinase [Gloeothece verrucosa PCC 7822]
MNEVDRLTKDLQQAQVAYQMAAQLSQFKTGFLARISHELRSPISTIMGLHQLILHNLCESPEEERESIEQAYQAIQKLLKMIDEILMVSKLEYGRISLNIISFSLEMVFADLYQFTHLQAANRNLKLEIILPQPALYIRADLEKFRQILITLVDTGINLTKEGTIQILAQVNPESDRVIIYLNIPCSVELWQEDGQFPGIGSEPSLETVKNFSKTLEMSPTLKFLLAQTLIEMMQGQLEILPMSPENQSQRFTQIQCLIPLASPESVAQEWATV